MMNHKQEKKSCLINDQEKHLQQSTCTWDNDVLFISASVHTHTDGFTIIVLRQVWRMEQFAWSEEAVPWRGEWRSLLVVFGAVYAMIGLANEQLPLSATN